MNILYLHGLESKLSPEKQKCLEQFGNVLAPDMDYYSNPKMFQFLTETYLNSSIDCIIGSSMGGMMGYYLAMELNCKALLFNPALTFGSVIQEIPEGLKAKENTYYQLILGWEDTVVPPKKTLEFLKNKASIKTGYSIKVIPSMEHRIPLDIFGKEVQTFFRAII